MASNNFPVNDAYLEDDVLEQCQHLLRTKSQEEVEWDGSGIGKWHRQQGCNDCCPHDNRDTSDSPLKRNQKRKENSYSPAKCLNSKENSPAKSNLAENVEDYSWDNQFDDIVLSHSPCERVDDLYDNSNQNTLKKSTKNKVKEVFQKSKDYLKSKVKSLSLFQSSNLMKGDNSKSSPQERADKGSNSQSFISKISESEDEKDDVAENSPFQTKSHIKSHSINAKKINEVNLDTEFENDIHGNSNNSTNDLGCPPAVTKIHSCSDVNGNLSQGSTCTNTNGHLRSSQPKKPETINMPGLLNTKGKEGNASFEDVSQTDVKETIESDDIQDTVQTPNGKNSELMKVEDIQIKVDTEEDIPLGTEANYFQSPVSSLNNRNLEYLNVGQAFDKRLSWLLGSTDQNSFGSDFSQNTATSSSSDKSLDMILMERTEDPEMILTNLGFAGTIEEQHKINRIPGRFLSHPSSAVGVDLQTLIDDDEDLGQILQAMAEQDVGLDQHNTSDVTGTGNPGLSNAFSSVVTGMKFISAFRNSQNPFSSTPVVSTEDKDTESEMSGNPSILHPLNREWLAKQGFYEKSVAVSTNKLNSKSFAPKLIKSVSTDAAERRKQFHQSKTTKHLSLTDVLETEENDSESKTSSSMTSFDREFQFRSFATSMDMSCDSFDSSDSPVYSSPGRNRFRRNDSLIDEEVPQVQNDNFRSQPSTPSGWSKIGNMRKNQVEKLMSLEVDDGDYVLSPQSSLERTLTWQKLHGMSERSNTVTSDDGTTDQNSNTVDSLDFKKENGSEIENEAQFKNIYSQTPSVNQQTNIQTVGENVLAFQSIPMLELSAVRKSNLDDSGDGNEITGNIGRMESIQSDSSGFAEADMTADHIIPEGFTQHRFLNLSPMSSAESDQTFKSGTTVLPGPGQPISPRLTFTPSCDLHTELQYIPEFFTNTSSQKIDKAVGTDDIGQLFSDSEASHNDIPTVTYHIHPQDKRDSGNETVSDNSLTLTIDIPKEWVKSSNRETVTKKRVVSHFYKHISPPKQLPSRPKQDFKSVVNFEPSSLSTYGALNNDVYKDSQQRLNYETDRNLKPKWASTPNPSNVVPVRSSTPYKRTGIPPKKMLFPKSSNGNRSVSPGESACSEVYPVFTKFRDWHDRSFQQSTESDLSDTSYVSKGESTSSLHDENIDYIKLMRLVNKPVSFKRSTRGTKASIRFKPKHNIKSWTHLNRQQHLEEETRLAQHALQRYKTELNVLETNFLVNSHLVKDELIPEEREDIEDLQLILSEVRKEIVEMEELLANRIAGLNIGNDNFSPLLLLDIIHKMTDLLKEQLFQQQYSADKDSDDESETHFQPTHQVPWWPEVSEQLYDIQQIVSKPPKLQLDKGLNDSLQELRHSILDEVRQELHDNTQWLQKELQYKDRELNRLKMEVMSQSVKKGQTRRKHYYESDV